MNTRYCLDTNALIHPWTGYYAPDLCPDYWDILRDLAGKGIIFCPEEVRRELEKKEDGLFKWANGTRGLFEPLSEPVQRRMREILLDYPRLVDTRKGRDLADPWVIASAWEAGATVVTRETVKNRGPDRYGIPEVCAELNIAYIGDHHFVRAVGIKLNASLDPPISARERLGFRLE